MSATWYDTDKKTLAHSLQWESWGYFLKMIVNGIFPKHISTF